MSRPSRIAIVKELGSRTPRCLAAHAVRGEGEPELVIVERYPASLGAETLGIIEEDAKELAALEHPNVASLIATAKLKGDVAVLSEWVDGESLATVRASGEKPPVPVLLRALLDVLEGISAVESQPGRVCGSITSDDVFVGMDGVTRITRFGLARVPVDALGARRKVYAPPELAHGERSVRGDVFVAGVLLWECLTGQTPTRDVSWGITPVDPKTLEPWARPLVPVIDKACAIDPAERYATPKEMSEAISAADPILITRAGVAQYIARAFGERISARLAKLEPKADVRLPSIASPAPTEPPPPVVPPPPAAAPAAAPAPAPAPAAPVAQAAPAPAPAPAVEKEKPQKAPDKPVEKASPEKTASARKLPVTDTAAAALARKPVPLPKRSADPIKPAGAAAPAKTNGSVAEAAATPPKPSDSSKTLGSSSAKVPVAKRAVSPEPAPEPKKPPAPPPEDVDVDLASFRPPPPKPPEPVPVPIIESVPPISEREEIDAEVDLVSVRPPAPGPAPAPEPPRPKPVPAAAVAAPAVAAVDDSAETVTPPKRSRAGWVVLFGIACGAGGFFAGRASMDAATTPTATSVTSAPATTSAAPLATPSASQAAPVMSASASATTSASAAPSSRPKPVESSEPTTPATTTTTTTAAAAVTSVRAPTTGDASSGHYNPSGI